MDIKSYVYIYIQFLCNPYMYIPPYLQISFGHFIFREDMFEYPT